VLNDELTRAHRATARTTGYWLVLSGLAFVFVAGLVGPLNFRLATMAMVTAGVAIPALTFSVLQRRAEIIG
jgi:hypothetical protein